MNAQRVKIGNEWDQVLGYESGEVKRRVDPFRTVDLGGYLKVAPVIAGVLYIATLLVQQMLPELFTLAYPFAVFVFTAPILYIVLAA